MEYFGFHDGHRVAANFDFVRAFEATDLRLRKLDSDVEPVREIVIVAMFGQHSRDGAE